MVRIYKVDNTNTSHNLQSIQLSEYTNSCQNVYKDWQNIEIWTRMLRNKSSASYTRWRSTDDGEYEGDVVQCKRVQRFPNVLLSQPVSLILSLSLSLSTRPSWQLTVPRWYSALLLNSVLVGNQVIISCHMISYCQVVTIVYDWGSGNSEAGVWGQISDLGGGGVFFWGFWHTFGHT